MGSTFFAKLEINGPTPRKELVTAMARANGRKVTKENYSSNFRGYGSVMIAHHERKGRITSTNAVYSLTEIGKDYVKAQFAS